MINLYGVIRSRSNRPHWALEELGVPYTFYQLNFSRGDQRSDFFLKRNPAGKMPVLEDGELTLTESGAICNYLGSKYPEKGLIPTGLEARASYDQWLCFVLTELEQPLWSSGKHRFALPEAQRIEQMQETARWEFDRAADLLSQALNGRQFMLEARFTMIDIFLAHTLRWADRFKFPIDYPGLRDYLERMEARPAFARMEATQTHDIPGLTTATD